MKPVSPFRPGGAFSLLCIGAHADDIEIGAGATLLGWVEQPNVCASVHWVVLSAPGSRAEEARSSAEALLSGIDKATIEVCAFNDAGFPNQAGKLKAWFEFLKTRISPDVILTHTRDDAHQDHRMVAQLTWNTFRNHLILEYEIPKWDGDLGRPNTYVPATRAVMERKLAHLQKHFPSQSCKDWFDRETFHGLARLRGMECRAEQGLAEAFHARKLVLE